MLKEALLEQKEVIEGLKAFFIAPDISVMPEDFLSHFFLSGFETYYILDDPFLDLASKIKVLLSLFPNVILFINIDRGTQYMNWPAFIRDLNAKHSERVHIGVFYSGTQRSADAPKMEKTYLYDIGISGGCIPIVFGKSKNLERLTHVLVANQANGQRKYLRALCGASSSFNLILKGNKFEGHVRDISISHFSCVFDETDPELVLYELMTGIQLKFFGTICTVDAVVCIKRRVGEQQLYVFVFRNSRGKDGLDPEQRAKVNSVIQKYYEKNVLDLVHSAFKSEINSKKAQR